MPEIISIKEDNNNKFKIVWQKFLSQSLIVKIASLSVLLLLIIIPTITSTKITQTFVEHAAPPSYPQIYFGTNYTHYSIGPNCDMDNTDIVVEYDKPNVRAVVNQQLQTMHSNGLQSIRVMLWFAHANNGNTWGLLPSSQNTLPDPYRTNLINFLTDVKKAGFTSVELAFGPEASNSPNLYYDPTKPTSSNSDGDFLQNGSLIYNPNYEQENKAFIASVHSIIKNQALKLQDNTTNNQSPSYYFDLSNEGAVGTNTQPNLLTQIENYDANLLRWYESNYGNDDETISYVGPTVTTYNFSNLVTLLKTLQQKNIAPPAYFEIHIYPDAVNKYVTPNAPSDIANTTTYDLQDLQNTLSTFHLNQPVVIGETFYNNQSIATSIKGFLLNPNSTLKIRTIDTWPLTLNAAQTPSCQISENAPYNDDSLINTFTQVDPNTTASLTCQPKNNNQISSLSTYIISASWQNITQSKISNAQVCVSQNGGQYVLFSGQGGTTNMVSAEAPWIAPGNSYHFELFDQGNTNTACNGKPLTSCTVLAPQASITCQTTQQKNTYNISATWKNLDQDAQVCVSQNGGTNRLFAARGGETNTISGQAPWIQPNNKYTFTLLDHSTGSTDCTGTILSTCTIPN